MKNTLAPAYEKETGVKIIYEITSVGSLPTRIATIAETGSGADITMNLTLIPFLYDEKYADVGDIAEEIGKEQGGWYDAARERRVVNGKWKAIPFCSIGQLMNWRTDWFAEVGVKKFPETWDELLRSRQEAESQRSPLRFRARPRLWRQPRLALSAAVVLWRARGGRRRQDRHDQFGRDRARRRFRRGNSSRIRCSRTCSAGPTSSNNKAWMAEQISCTNNAESILWFAKREFPRYRQGHRAGAEPGRAEGSLPSS